MSMHTVKNESVKAPSFLELPGKRLAYCLTEGLGPCVVFLGGFKSDMTGNKARAVEDFCRAQGQRCLRFDYRGHGQSSGDFRDGTIGGWAEDAGDMLEHIVKGPCILVGSSMGAWLALLTALARPQQVKALVGIASAPDFTERLIWQQFSAAQHEQMEVRGEVLIPDCYGGEPYPITRALVEEGRRHLLLGGEIPLDIPVRLLHGTQDRDVPWTMSQELLEKLAARDVTLQLVKGGDHRLSEPAHLALLRRTIAEVVAAHA